MAIFTFILLLSLVVPVIQYGLNRDSQVVETLEVFTPEATRTQRPTITPRPYPLPATVTFTPYP